MSTPSELHGSLGRSKTETLPLEIAIDLEADNVMLRAALARSASADVRRDLVTQELKHRIGNLLAVVQAVARQTFSAADGASALNDALGVLSEI